MRTQQIKIILGLQSSFSVVCISHHMGKHPAVRIFPGLASIIADRCLCKYCSIRSSDISTDYMLRIQIQTGIIGTIDHTFAFHHLEINKIADHSDKNCQK